MSLTPFDVFLTFCLVVGLPLWALRSWRRLHAQIAARDPEARVAAYRRVLVVQWSLVGFLLVHALLRSIDLSGLGFDLPDGRRGLGSLFVAIALSMFIFGQARAARTDEATQASARKQMEALRSMLPHTPREYAWFRAVAWTAGICEEILYRGYLPWILAHSMPVGWAYALAVLAFGVGHLYQGVAGVAKTAIVGAIMAGLTWASGSLIPAILLHVAIDAVNGRLAYTLLTSKDTPSTTDDD